MDKKQIMSFAWFIRNDAKRAPTPRNISMREALTRAWKLAKATYE